jgi:hypothetical protein
MAEEQEESTGKSFKGILITLVSTVTLGVGGWITTKLTGGDKEETPTQQVAQPSIIINNSQQQQAAGGTKTVVIKEKASEAKPVAPAPKKKDGDEFKEEAPKW